MGKQFQLELFKSPQYQSDARKKEFNHRFFGLIKLHEKPILIIIVIFIISLIFFSLGVEKGKKLTFKKIEPAFKQANQGQIKQKSKELLLIENQQSNKNLLSKYTIQVASFKTEAYARKEVKRLQKKGVRAWVTSKGNYACVCVGKFLKKQEAKTTLNQLKKMYQDCFITRL